MKKKTLCWCLHQGRPKNSFIIHHKSKSLLSLTRDVGKYFLNGRNNSAIRSLELSFWTALNALFKRCNHEFMNCGVLTVKLFLQKLEAKTEIVEAKQWRQIFIWTIYPDPDYNLQKGSVTKTKILKSVCHRALIYMF